ncbi:hypothetical protein [Sphingomonas sp. VNH70]|uniref:hypothetical protein n=1 Tax=Sphingomonas silueang TaxID=3156617 RepID=UPI0032B59A3F
MTDGQTIRSSGHVVVIGDEASFAGGYIAAVLRDHALSVIGPISALPHAIELVKAPETRVVVFIEDVAANAVPDLLSALADRGLPCLTLTAAGTPPSARRHGPILPQPFAAFQVARWVLEQLPR